MISRCVDPEKDGTSTAYSCWLVKSSLEEENLTKSQLLPRRTRSPKKVSKGAHKNAKSNWNEEATATEVEAAKVPVEDQECQTRDSNISKSIIGNDLDYNNYCLECKYILYHWHLLFVSGLGQCYDT